MKSMKRSIKVQRLIDELGLTPLYVGERDIMDIDTSDLNRPGLQMSGFFEYFAVNRIQLFGMAEMTYLQDMSHEVRKERLETYFNNPIPCVMIARNLTPPEELLEAAKKYDVPVLMSGLTTTKLSHMTTLFLDNELAPCIARHGGLMDVYGVGIFITGESGVGKSETALELVKRGHRLVADDVVEIRKISDTNLVGSSPDVIRHLMEIRGIGLIDVSVLYGMGAVMMQKTISLCIHLELGDVKDIDRVGLSEDSITLLGIKIPKITIPVRPGRNIAIILEVAAMNFRLKSLGHDATANLDQKMLELLG